MRSKRCAASSARRIHERDLWVEIKRRFALQIAGVPDSDFYRTFLNSITRDVFATIGVDEEIEFTATAAGRASGSVPSASTRWAIHCSGR